MAAKSPPPRMPASPSAQQSVVMPAAMHAQLREFAQRDAPLETVGLIGGRDGEFTALARASNHSPTPSVAFYVEPEVQIRLVERLEEGGHEVVGVFHSHPAGEARPSKMDLSLAAADWLMVIVSLPQDEVRCFDHAGCEVEIIVPQEDDDL